MDEMVELGRRNAELWPKVQNWCSHIRIKQETAGLLAEMHQLPIGSMSIHCEHASGFSMQAMQLLEVATDFIVRNCDGCPHHDQTWVDSIGHSILRENRSVLAERQAQQEEQVKLRDRLREQIKGELDDALRAAATTEQSILKLVYLLQDEERAGQAAQMLAESARIAPELFGTVAVEVICGYFSDSKLGTRATEIVDSLVQSSDILPTAAVQAAERCLTEGVNTDGACLMFGHHMMRDGSAVTPELVGRILAAQDYYAHWRYRDEDHRGGTFALTVAAKANLDVVKDAFKARLANNHKQVRVNTLHALNQLLPEFPQLGFDLMHTMIDTLDLDDDGYMESADGMACGVLAELYSLEPRKVQAELERATTRLSLEAQKELLGVYDDILHRSHWNDDQTSKESYQACVPFFLDFVLGIVGDKHAPLDIREEAAKVVGDLKEETGYLLLDRMDSLVGLLADFVRGELMAQKRKSRNTLEGLENYREVQQHQTIARHIRDALGVIAKSQPEQVFSHLQETIPRLSSTDSAEERLKEQLASLLAHVLAHRNLAPRAIPLLYKLIMDFESVRIRRTGVNLLGELLDEHPDSVPRNLIDVLILYLHDDYVAVHMAATRAIRHYSPRDETETLDILNKLSALNDYYRQQKEKYFLEDIRRAFSHLLSFVPRASREFLGDLILDHANMGSIYERKDALRDLRWRLNKLPLRYETEYIRISLELLKDDPPDFMNNRDGLRDDDLGGPLFERSKDAVSPNVELIFQIAELWAGASLPTARQALFFSELLAQNELYGEAARVADIVLRALPRTTRNASLIQFAAQIQALCQAEALVTNGRLEDARTALEDAAKLEKDSSGEEGNGKEFNLADTFAVAQAVSERLGRL